MIHRHLDYSQGTPPAQLGPAAIDDLLDRGDLADWAPVARIVADEPWGSLADTVLRLCTAHPMYGTSRLWTAYIGACRTSSLGGGTASWPTRPRKATLGELRLARGLSQAAVGAKLGMNQSEVSRLERRRDMRLSTLRSYVDALGGRIRTLVTWPDRSRQFDLVVGDSNSKVPENVAE
jgi:Helix-turn-helix domain